MAVSSEALAPLAGELADLIGVSERYTSRAAQSLSAGISRLGTSEFCLELHNGLGEGLLTAYYKALAMLKPGQANWNLITNLYHRHRFFCAMHGLVDQKAQHFLIRHGLDREIQESTVLHTATQAASAGQLEALAFGSHLAGYFGIAPPTAPDEELIQLELKPWFGALWTFQSQGPIPSGLVVYLLVPLNHLAVACETTLCRLVAKLMPVLGELVKTTDAVICSPLGTRKLSLSKQGHLSSSTYFDGAKPVPFSLNRAIEPYLLVSGSPLADPADLTTAKLWFAPVIDSLSSLVYREPEDYRLGDSAFQHQPLLITNTAPLAGRGRAAGLMTPTPTPALVGGLFVQAGVSAFELSACHHLCDRYARAMGYCGHGPSGVMNQSVLMTQAGELSTWRYERNFDSWSGRSADVARHPSLNFMGWQQSQPQGGAEAVPLRLQPLSYGGFPSECKVEDLRLLSHQGDIYATAALILPGARYREWLPEISADAAANNTIDDMVVVQALGRLNLDSPGMMFYGLPSLEPAQESDSPQSAIPSNFEKNWLIHSQGDDAWLFYSVQPWRIYLASESLLRWRPWIECNLKLPASIPGPLRNSAPPFAFETRGQSQPANTDQRLGLVVHHRRSGTYIYDQYLIVINAQSLLPILISRIPILSVNASALTSDHGFRKNDGVCYVSSAVVVGEELRLYFNLFDCRTCVLSIEMNDLTTMIDTKDNFLAIH
jgi:hypothetical protein